MHCQWTVICNGAHDNKPCTPAVQAFQVSKHAWESTVPLSILVLHTTQIGKSSVVWKEQLVCGHDGVNRSSQNLATTTIGVATILVALMLFLPKLLLLPLLL